MRGACLGINDWRVLPLRYTHQYAACDMVPHRKTAKYQGTFKPAVIQFRGRKRFQRASKQVGKVQKNEFREAVNRVFIIVVNLNCTEFSCRSVGRKVQKFLRHIAKTNVKFSSISVSSKFARSMPLG